MSLVMIIWTQGDDIGHTICTVMGESDYMATLQIGRAIHALKPECTAKFTFAFGTFLHSIADFCITGILDAGRNHLSGRIYSNVVDCIEVVREIWLSETAIEHIIRECGADTVGRLLRGYDRC